MLIFPLKSGSKIADSVEISETYKHVTAHDLQCLKSQGYVNDAIISSASMAINASCQGVFAVFAVFACNHKYCQLLF